MPKWLNYRILVRLLVLSPVRRVGESLRAAELLRELAAERLVAGVRPKVDLAVLEAGERAGAALKLLGKGGIISHVKRGGDGAA